MITEKPNKGEAMANGNGHALDLAQLPGEAQTLVTTIINAAVALAQLQKGNWNEGSNPFGVATSYSLTRMNFDDIKIGCKLEGHFYCY